MGTNYYAIPKADEQTKVKIKEAIDADNLALARELMPEQIHLGKSSGGWEFLFNHNDWRYFSDLGTMVEFINNCDIHNEYGDKVTPSAFWHMVDNKSNSEPELQYGSRRFGYNFSNYTDFS